MISVRTKITVTFTAALILIGLDAFLSLRLAQREQEDAQWVEHSHIVITQLQDADLNFDRVNHEIRLLAPEPGLQSTGAALARLDSVILAARGGLESVHALVSDSPEQTARVNLLMAMVDSKTAGIRQMAEDVVRGNGDAPSRNRIATASSDLSEPAQTATARIRQAESALLATRIERSRQSAQSIRVLMRSGFMTAILVGFLGLWVTLRDLKRREMVEQRLGESRDAAEEAVRAKSEFLATMSHEIRTPLNGVIGMTGLLLDTSLTAEQLEYVSTVRHSGAALLAVVNDILDFSRIEAGKLDLEEVDFALFATIRECGEIVAASAHQRGVKLTLPVAGAIPVLVRGDRNRLRQVLLNLLSNAIKFTAEGEVAVTVSVTMDAQHSSGAAILVRFEVRDTGPGISEEAQSRLFRAFSQADSSTTRKFGGTGLGLAISKRLVELMGGEIGVNSEAGQGSCFWFTARLGMPRNAEPAQPLLTGRLILVVDADAGSRRALELQLEGNGCMVRAVEGAPEAFAALDTSRRSGRAFDAALFDLRPPENEGIMLVESIRALPGFHRIPILILASNTDREFLRETAANEILEKPVSESQLLRSLQRVFSAPRSVEGAHWKRSYGRRARVLPRADVDEFPPGGG